MSRAVFIRPGILWRRSIIAQNDAVKQECQTTICCHIFVERSCQIYLETISQLALVFNEILSTNASPSLPICLWKTRARCIIVKYKHGKQFYIS